MNIEALTNDVLNDPNRTRAVVAAAANLLNQLEETPSQSGGGKPITTDKTLMAAGSDLKGAFAGWDSGKYGGKSQH